MVFSCGGVFETVSCSKGGGKYSYKRRQQKAKKFSFTLLENHALYSANVDIKENSRRRCRVSNTRNSRHLNAVVIYTETTSALSARFVRRTILWCAEVFVVRRPAVLGRPRGAAAGGAV